MDIETHHPKRKKQISSSCIPPNLLDAESAGGKFSHRCILFLAVGGEDSVRDFTKALCGICPKYHGFFPLEDDDDDDLINVREASHNQIRKNAGIQHIIRILGLVPGKVYHNVKSLRYGKVIIVNDQVLRYGKEIIVTDQDRDVSLIKGLFINFIRFFWPSLLQIPKFLMELNTPQKEMYAIEYRIEARKCFQNLETHLRYFTWVDETDGDAIDMAYDVNILQRKAWNLKFTDESNLDDDKMIRYREFVAKDLMLYSLADMQQSIPSMFDGLNEVQRAILYCAFKLNFVTETFIFGFLDYVYMRFSFLYDVETLTEAIIGMSHDFVGTNNVNLFNPRPRFRGGKGHAPAECMRTNLTPIARLLFPKDDDILLNNMNEDGQPFQPTRYAPVIPLILVNGCRDFGIGWSTFVPNYDPKDLCANVRCLLDGVPMVPMDPWYKGFQGTIERNGASYTTSGKIEYINDMTLQITVLPVHTLTECYKEFLDTLCTGGTGEIDEPFIKSYRKLHDDDTTVQFEIIMSKQNMKVAMEEGLVKKFKLTSTISTNYMHLCDPQGVIMKYDSPEQILEKFFNLRLRLYEKRMKMLLACHGLELFKIEKKEQFIRVVIDNNDWFVGWERAEIFNELKQRGLLVLFQKTKTFDVENSSLATCDLEVNEEQVSSFYNDLMSSMNLGTLASREKLELQKENITFQMEELKSSTPKKLYMKDIDTLEQKLLHELNNKDAIAEAEVDIENEADMAVERATPVGLMNISWFKEHHLDMHMDDNISEKLHGISLQKLRIWSRVVAAPT